MTKTKLFTAASAAAILLAGAAQAGEITGTLGTVAFDDTDAYTVVEERVISADAPVDGEIVLAYAPAGGVSVATGSTADYRLTFTVTGGEFASPTTATLAVTNAGDAGTGVTNGLRNATTLTYIINVTGGAAPDTITAMTASGAELSLESSAEVSVSATLELLAGGVPSTIDTAEVDVVDYAPFFEELTAVAVSDATATLPDFTTFGGSDNANLGRVTVTTSTDDLYSDLEGTAAIAADIADGYTLTVTGGQFDELAVTAGGVAPEEGFTASSADFEFAALATLNAATVNIENEDEVRIQPNDYSASVAINYADDFAAATSFDAVDLGSVLLEGTNFIAPWISGSQAQTQSTIRLSNTGAAEANVTLRVTNGVFNFNGTPTTFADKDCALGQLVLPAAGDLVVSPAVMTQCFGAFTRGDILITVEADESVITAKVRNSNASGAFETSLGRYSGTSEAPN